MKPQDFFLSLREFLAILVPGLLLLYALLILDREQLPVEHPFAPATGDVPGVKTLVFAACAYGLGSIAHALGSRLDLAYDRLELLFTPVSRRSRLAEFDAFATALKHAAIADVLGQGSTLAAGWSNKSFLVDYLRIACPEATVQLERIEGMQKLFRSLSIVLIALSLNAVLIGSGSLAGMFLALAGICILFYAFNRSEWNYRLVKWAFITRIPRTLNVAQAD